MKKQHHRGSIQKIDIGKLPIFDMIKNIVRRKLNAELRSCSDKCQNNPPPLNHSLVNSTYFISFIKRNTI